MFAGEEVVSECPNCIIDLYTDDNDIVDEALTYLGEAIADVDGNFVFTMTEPLPAGVGIRTTSTTQSLNIIQGMQSGTTTRNSRLYLPVGTISITLPISTVTGSEVAVSINAGPTGVTFPVELTIEITDFTTASLTLTSEEPFANATLSWNTPGTKAIRVTADNGLGSLTVLETIEIELAEEPEEEEEEQEPAVEDVYIPSVNG